MMTSDGVDVERENLGEVSIGREVFEIRKDHGVYKLHHPKWSLMGRGETVAEAVQDVRINAGRLLPIYAPNYPEGMTKGAREMVDYMLEIYDYHEDEEGNCLCFTCRSLRQQETKDE